MEWIDNPDDLEDCEYLDLNNFVEQNWENLKDGIINIDELQILSKLLITDYCQSNIHDIKVDIQNLYQQLFQYIYRPTFQHYENVSDIHVAQRKVLNYLYGWNGEKSKNYEKIYKFIQDQSKESIDFFKFLYNLWKYDGQIVEKSVFETLNIDNILNEDYLDELIKKFAVNEDIRKEYCDE